METVTVEQAQEILKALLESAASGQSTYRITSEQGTAVLLSEENYQNLMITLEMLSTPIFLEKEQPQDINN